MKLADVLSESSVRVGVSAATLDDAAELLLRAVAEGSAIPDEHIARVAEELASGETGSTVRANDDVILAAVESSDAPDIVAAMGVFPLGFGVPDGPDETLRPAKVVLLIVTPHRVGSLRAEAFPRLARAFRSGDVTSAVLASATPAAVLGVEGLTDKDLLGTLLVSDAMSVVSFRIYPDTPLPEVLDLMARRDVQVLPVVGADYEVLGLISRGDALGQMIQRIGVSEEETAETDAALARDIMSRSVLCVEEDQTLLEAARLMVNKGFERLPVVRDGELVGFVTEEAALRMLGSALS